MHGYEKKLPLPLGYYLVKNDVRWYSWPGKKYRGVDRLPCEPDDNPHENELNFKELWDEYWISEKNNELHVNLLKAKLLQKKFEKYNFRYEIIYVQIEALPRNMLSHPSKERWNDLVNKGLDLKNEIFSYMKGVQVNVDLIGYDIASPFLSMHSALYQPNLEKKYPDLGRILNSYGLFSDINKALFYLDAANELDYAPFCLLSVSKTE